MTTEDNAVQNQRLDNHETRIRQLEMKVEENTRSVVKLEVIIENLGKRWDSLEGKLFEYMNKLNASSANNTLEWSGIVKEAFKVIIILTGAIASVKFFGN